jgi:D-tagatose-1,6-bisphosphate aldolase subunit GatZ/KbaZ
MSKDSLNSLRARLQEHKTGLPIGVFSVCSSHPVILESTLKYSSGEDFPVLIETTCNQVNQFGGYSGQTPSQFAANLNQISSKLEFPTSRLILGGDHLGPFPWRSESSQTAMGNACQMVNDYVLAGYGKIHLDASMHCGDDDHSQQLDTHVSARRTAQLCQAAEIALPDGKTDCLYIIGSEVPPPGGDQAGVHELQITSPEKVSETIQVTKQEFHKIGLHSAWERVIAIVVQPGVEFFDQSVHYYAPNHAADLSTFIENYPRLIYEAHSTDYQTPESLQQLVKDHFAILKVGPELTFAYREIIFALEQIELQIVKYEPRLNLSNLSNIIDKEMVSHSEYWDVYYSGNKEEIAYSRKYSYLDRIRYYWNRPNVQQALSSLFSNLNSFSIPQTLISQFLPERYLKIKEGELNDHPDSWVEDKIFSVLNKYHQAISFDFP